MTYDQRTQDYVARRIAEGMVKKDIVPLPENGSSPARSTAIHPTWSEALNLSHKRPTIYRSRPFTCGDAPRTLLAKCAVMPRV
jgi:hypothetical protein